MDNRPFDLARLDTEGIRKRLRRRLVLFSLPICLVALVAALMIAGVVISQMLGARAYDDRSYSVAAQHFGRFRPINWFEAYKMDYNYGTALLGDRQYQPSIAALKASLERSVPEAFECQVRVNLVLALTGYADSLLQTKAYDQAILTYDDAKAVIDARDCGLKSNPDQATEQAKQANQQLQAQRQTVNQKQNQAKQLRNGNTPAQSSSSNEGTSAENSSTPSPDQLQSLQDQQTKNSAATRQERSAARSINNSTYSSRDYKSKNW